MEQLGFAPYSSVTELRRHPEAPECLMGMQEHGIRIQVGVKSGVRGICLLAYTRPSSSLPAMPST